MRPGTRATAETRRLPRSAEDAGPVVTIPRLEAGFWSNGFPRGEARLLEALSGPRTRARLQTGPLHRNFVPRVRLRSIVRRSLLNIAPSADL
jgi:hypothetical protein